MSKIVVKNSNELVADMTNVHGAIWWPVAFQKVTKHRSLDGTLIVCWMLVRSLRYIRHLFCSLVIVVMFTMLYYNFTTDGYIELRVTKH